MRPRASSTAAPSVTSACSIHEYIRPPPASSAESVMVCVMCAWAPSATTASERRAGREAGGVELEREVERAQLKRRADAKANTPGGSVGWRFRGGGEDGG